VTKGAFFHHFPSKDDLAIAAADQWSEMTGALFAAAPYHLPEDPLDRILGYIDFRAEIIAGDLHDFTCLVGTMVQETFTTHTHIRDACARSIIGHAASLEPYFAAALERYQPAARFTPRSLALHTQAVLQGAFILAKATNDPETARESIRHLRTYIKCLFEPEKTGRNA
jgi:TetR/AcrR family transcriptional repressor of nem operon